MQKITKQMMTGLLMMGSLFFVSCNDDATQADNVDNAADSTGGVDFNNNNSDNGGTMAMATLSGTKADTTVSGTVRFEQNGGEVKMTIEISVPKKANSSVALHFHEMGDCGNDGEHAMGHWNPTNEPHGRWGSGQFHSGDIGNIDLDGSGNGRLEVSSDRWSIGGDATKDIVNKSIIVHSGVDDYTSQPSGNSGSRIGCGVINRGNQNSNTNQPNP